MSVASDEDKILNIRNLLEIDRNLSKAEVFLHSLNDERRKLADVLDCMFEHANGVRLLLSLGLAIHQPKE